MSGMKRRVQPTGSNSSLTQPAIQMYNPNQYSTVQTPWRQQEMQTPNPNENNWYNSQMTQNQTAYNGPAYGQAQQHQPSQHMNYWQQQQPLHGRQLNTIANYNQEYALNSHSQSYYDQQNSTYNYEGASNLLQDPQFSQQTEEDPWNWGWGDEDNSNLHKRSTATAATLNATNSLGIDDSWNSTFTDTNINAKSSHTSDLNNVGAQNVENKHPMFAKMSQQQDKNQQWSMDSQLSLDSSHPVHTSESDKSHILSRSSTVSESPVSGHLQVENYAAPDTDMNTSSSSNSLQHENREVLNFQESLSINNYSAPLIPTSPIKSQTPPAHFSQPASSPSATDSINPFKRSTTLPKPHKTDFYSNNYVNLESMPDNSEHPDCVPLGSLSSKFSPIHIKPENNEIASINDRNQYLETGQLESTPSGLGVRLVVGQHLQQPDEPPPGLSRMVLGQTETNEPPLGFQRLVPGECSSPEMYPPGDNLIRSATIGADTSPLTIANSTGPYNIRETNVDGANNLDEDSNLIVNRRNSIDGQPQIDSVAKLTNSVRDLVIGENATDTVGSAIVSDRITRGSSRQDSSDTEAEDEREKIVKENKDRRYQHEQYERQKTRRRYSPSPDRYRDKKYERRRYTNRRYDDDTDYYSDKEKDRRKDDRGERLEDFDRKYSSLKRDEKDRKRRDPRSRDYGKESRRNDYYSRYEDDFEDSHRSRPTSRSDSMHDSYRPDHHDRHRDRDRHRRHRGEPFNPYMQGYPYDPYNSYYHQYQYYENLRRTNPQAYAEWYRKYYQQTSAAHPGYGNDDRASVHSGRSSANEELVKERPFDQTDSSLYLDETTATSQRFTPAKFATPHVKASLTSGHLVKVFPHYPLDGQTATVEVGNLHDMLRNDDGYRELIENPGPLVKGITHKKTIIEYCENKIRNAIYSRDISDIDSYILMWELLILLLRQNGMVVGTDIAELLMKNRKQLHSSRRASVSSHGSIIGDICTPEGNNVHTSENSTSSTSILKEEVITNKFREYLIYGSEQEALEWAMKHGLWGHALFLASKLDKRTYANVMTRFANGLSMNDPLQTLYQLLSGKVPSAVTCVIDEKWGDWRPHLAMVLSNTTQRPELDQKAIITLGDTLLGRGSLYAAQFCYLMVQVGFSRYGNPDAKLVLLGSNHTKPFAQFSINEAIMMTEIYEYACSLNDGNFLIPEFLPYKYLLASRMADYGLLEKSLAYLEKIAVAVIQNPTLAQHSLIVQTCELANHLKYSDPLEEQENSDEPYWLTDLKTVEKDFNLGLIKQISVENFLVDTPEQDYTSAAVHTDYKLQNSQEAWQQPWQSVQSPEQQPHLEYNQLQQSSAHDAHGMEAIQEQQNWPQQHQQQQWGKQTGNPPDYLDLQTQNDYWSTAKVQDTPLLPQISMPNQVAGSALHGEEDPKPKQENVIKHKAQPEKSNNSGWFGGIFSKLSLRPKNQMKLPDDKNPTIVWDETRKRWINKDDDGDEGVAELRPPPKAAEIFPNDKTMPMPNSIQNNIHYQNNNNISSLHTEDNPKIASTNLYNCTGTSQQNMVEPILKQPMSNHPNMFKLQRGRNLKKPYVDVFNPGSNVSASMLPALDAPGIVANNFNYFVPAPINDPNAPMDFLTPAPLPQEDTTQL